MELTQLRYFLKTAETLNYTKAAEALFTSRQALCHALGNLEKELGQPLFSNDRNRLSLTEYGIYLLRTFEDLVRDFEDRETQVKEFFRQPVILRVSFSVSLFPFHLPNIDPILGEFRAQHPNIALELQRQTADEVMEAVQRGELDCGVLLRMPSPLPGCISVPLRTSAVAIGSGLSSPLCGKAEITPEDLAAVPMVGMGSLENIALPLWEYCRQQGIRLDYRVVPDSVDALYQIKNGMASGFNTFFNAAGKNLSHPHDRPRTLLKGYTWEVAALCPENRPNHPATLLLAEFLRESYQE